MPHFPTPLKLAACVAGAVGADFFNVYLAVSDNTIDNEVSRINSALKNDQMSSVDCKYLIKYEHQELAVEEMTRSRMLGRETNGCIDISREKDGQSSGYEVNSDASGIDEKIEDQAPFELENER